MKSWAVMLLLFVATGLVGAADDGDGKGNADVGHAGVEEMPAPSGATPERKPPRILSWEVQIGVEPPQSKALIVLLPNANGKPSAVIVTTAQGEAVLDRPYAAADVGGKGAIDVGEISPDEVRKRFGAALEAQPPRPISWMLYFTDGSNKLTAESKAALEKIKAALKAELARRTTAEILVVGHTDRLGTVSANDALSLKRARFIAEKLVATGIAKRQMEVSGRGTREPQVPSADRRAEPKNRRVEIVIR